MKKYTDSRLQGRYHVSAKITTTKKVLARNQWKYELPSLEPMVIIAFRSSIWRPQQYYNREAHWLKKSKPECANVLPQDDLKINKNQLETVIQKMARRTLLVQTQSRPYGLIIQNFSREADDANGGDVCEQKPFRMNAEMKNSLLKVMHHRTIVQPPARRFSGRC